MVINLMEGSHDDQKAAIGDFPAGQRILVVDDSETYIFLLQKMLNKLHYQVTICHGALQALQLLREDKTRFDLILSDLHMPEMSGIDLLRAIVSETDLPVVIMSADYRREVVTKGITNGACDYLIKPISAEVMQVMWQHIIRKKRDCFRMSKAGENVQKGGTLILQQQKQRQNIEDDNSNVLSPQQNLEKEGENEKNSNTLKRKKENEDESEVSDSLTNRKKRRIVWTSKLHEKFIIAVKQLGGDKAVPKRILERMKEMNICDLSRENVASHLQKYRLSIQKTMEESYEDQNQSNLKQLSPSINPVSSAAHHGSLNLATTNPNLVAAVPISQRNIFDGAPSFSQYNGLTRSCSGPMMPYHNLPLPVSEGYHEFNPPRRNLSVGNGLSILSEPGGSGLRNLPTTVVNPIIEYQISNSFDSRFLGSNFYSFKDIYNGATTASNDLCSPWDVDYAATAVPVPHQNINLPIQIRKEPEYGSLENDTMAQNVKDLPMAAVSYHVKGENMNEFISDQPETVFW